MSFGVIVTEKNAPPAQGAPTDTGVWHVTAPVGAGSTAAAVKVHSLDEFVGAYADSTDVVTAPLYNAVDAFFREGGAAVNVAGHTPAGTYADGLALLNDWRQGPGQLSVLGTPPSAAVAAAVSTVCDATNRVGVLDVADGDTVAQMVTHGTALPVNNDLLAMFSSWCHIPGPAGVIGAGPRSVPASPIIAALCNRVDQNGNPNRAAAGRDYPLQYVTDFETDPSDLDRTNLLTHGVNAFTDDFGVLENYGFQTAIQPTATTPFWQFNASRCRMWIKAQAKAIGAPYVFRPIDAEGHLIGALLTDLDAMLLRLYEVDGLYGATPQEAFSTQAATTIDDTGLGHVHVSLSARYSLYAKAVLIDLVSVPVSGAV